MPLTVFCRGGGGGGGGGGWGVGQIVEFVSPDTGTWFQSKSFKDQLKVIVNT